MEKMTNKQFSNNNVRIFAFILILITVVLGRKFLSIQADSFIDMRKALSKENVIDLLIIGSGPAGLQAATYGGRFHLNTWVLEGNEPGGLLTKTTLVENWPGEMSILGPDIMAKLKAQALDKGARILSDSAIGVDFSQYPFVIHTEEGHKLHALSVIIATGATPKKLGIPGEEAFWGMGVTTCAVCDAPFYKGLNVVVIGGGDSAVEEAIQLSPYAKQITIMVRKGAMRAAPSMQKRLAGYPNITVRYNVEVTEIHGDEQGVSGITVYHNSIDTSTSEPISGVFLAVGHTPNTQIFEKQIDLHDSGHIVLKDRSQKTSVLGIFTAGDVADREYRQAGVAAGDGIKAAMDVDAFLTKYGYNQKIVNQLEEVRFLPVVDGQVIVPHLLSLDELERFVTQQPGLVVIDFYAEYCPSCMQMLPALNTVAQYYEGKVAFFKVDIESALDITQALHVQKVPCIMAFRDGKLIARYNTTMSRSELRALVNQLIEGN